jgi:hypothetical protein
MTITIEDSLGKDSEIKQVSDSIYISAYCAKSAVLIVTHNDGIYKFAILI